MLAVLVEIAPYTSITSAFTDALELSEKLGVPVAFRFNGTRCEISPGDCTVPDAVDRYMFAMRNCKDRDIDLQKE